MFNKYSEEWLLSHYRPIKGGDGEGESGEEPAAGGEPEDELEGSTEEEGGGEGESGGSEEDHSGDGEADELDRIKSERDQARSQVAAAEAAARKAKAEAKAARETAAKKDGNWEQVAKERQAELDEANERATAAETRAYEAEDKLDKFQREVRITRIASKLFFRDPADAIAWLKDRPEDTGDDKACERALRKLADDKPYAVDQKRARGRAMSGGGNNGMALTHEQMKNMTPDEINQHWDKVQASLSRSGGGG